MATLKSIATGNFLTAGTWGLCNATAESDDEAGSTALTTPFVLSAAFTPGIITVDGICVKVQARAASPTGTITIELFNSTASAAVAGASVTANATDMPACDTTDLQGGWVYFKFAAPVVLLAATAYKVQAKVSVTNSVTLYRTATAGDWSRQLVTTTTQAPAAGDKLIVIGEKTGAGASNSFTVTMNETATTNYGTASITIPSLSVGHNGTLTYGTTAATNYVLRLNGIAVVYAGGTLNMGTTGTKMPRDSSAVLEFSVASVAGGGLDVRGGTCVGQGQSRTVGKLIDRCYLNADQAAAATTLNVDTDTGWLAGDEVVVSSTTRITTQTELKTLTAGAGASSLPVAAMTNAHDGTAEKAEIILLSRNVIIRSTSSTNVAYVRIRKTAVVDFDWLVIKDIGSATVGKQGVYIETTTAGGGSVAMNNVCVRNSLVSGLHIVGTDNIAINDFTTYSCVTGINGGSTTGANNTVVLNNVWSIGGTTCISSITANITLTNIRALAASNTGILWNDIANAVSTGTVNNLYARGNNVNYSSAIAAAMTMTNIVGRRANQYGWSFSPSMSIIFDTFDITGSGIANIYISSTYVDNVTFRNAVIAGDTVYPSLYGIYFPSFGIANLIFENSTFGVVSGTKTNHGTADISSTTGSSTILLRNCILATPTEIAVQTTMGFYSRVISEKHDQVSGALKIFARYGTITKDTTIFDTASPSYRLTPNNASLKLSHTVLRAAVASGTTATVSVKVRESVVGDGTAYNGARIRLFVKRNAIAGITADTLLATATAGSSGAFETLTGTTISVSENCILEFYIDCNGTTGWVNTDTITPPATVDTLGLASGDETLFLPSYGNNATGGGGNSAFAFC